MTRSPRTVRMVRSTRAATTSDVVAIGILRGCRDAGWHPGRATAALFVQTAPCAQASAVAGHALHSPAMRAHVRLPLHIFLLTVPLSLFAQTDARPDPVKTLVERLDLERYKATIKGLTQFGDRRQGTDRNRAAMEWIEAQLLSYGCPAERIHYDYQETPRNPNRGRGGLAQGGGRPRG